MKKFSWLTDKIEVRNTGKIGKGIYANSEIEKNEIICIFGGYVMTRKEEDKLPKSISDMGLQISENCVLGIYNENTELEDACFFNHSCDPNAGFHGQIYLVAMKTIAPDEHITFDYGMVLYRCSESREYKLKCLCGSEKCRSIITEYDWQIKELQERYHGYFQWYLQEKINNLSKI